MYPLELNIYSSDHLALRTKFPIKQIIKITECKSSKVKTFSLKKETSDGRIKERIIYNPFFDYKKVLRNVNKYLLNSAFLPPGVCGGVAGKTLKDMVQIHCGKEAIYTIDLKDFYPNISSCRIFKFFLNSNCSYEISKILTNLVTYNNQLPQGFPTSTMLANIVAFKLDLEHLAICKKFNLARTRWIDDIVFSGRLKDLEASVPKINCAAKYNGFELNKDKQIFYRRKNEPKIVGLLVNKHKPHIPKGIIEKVKEILIIAKLYGTQVAQTINEVAVGKKDFKASLVGKINNIAIYNPADAIELESLFNTINWVN